VSEPLFLCATTRLAQALRSAVPAGQIVWRTPQALTLGQWFGALADEALVAGRDDLPLGLDPFAEKLLWEKIIAASLSEASPLFDIQGMAASASEAHALSRIWNIRPAVGMLSDEARLFTGWQAEFEKRCRTGGWIDTAGLHWRLIGLIESGHFNLPEAVTLVGFDRLTPLEERLIAVLSARGIAVGSKAGQAGGAGKQQVVACPDSAAECASVAAWAQARLAVNPDLRLGIVVPDLAGVRDRLEFALDDALHPGLIRAAAAEMPRTFNFSLGRALADLPLVRTALDLLSLGGSRGKVEQSRLSALLLAGGWSAAQAEADGRARLDLALRRDLPYFTSLRALLALAARLADSGNLLCPESLAALQRLLASLDGQTRSLRPSLWAGIFRQVLRDAGWPGDRALSSHEFQTQRAFLEALDSFGRFDALLGPLPLNEAIRRLTQFCRQRIFQPETRGRPSIQVLGVLESAGLAFDALWVMGMNDDLWPPAPRPNPLLPADVQRATGSAHASAEVELAFARRVHERLLQAAPDVTFSWARADGNRLLRPSPLVAGVSAGHPCLPAVQPLAARLAQAAADACEYRLDALAPPVAEGEKVSGGSWLLRAQAICPAWAYFQYRLGAEAMEEAVEGLDPAARGTLVHAALESFWLAVRNSTQLKAQGEITRRQAIADAVRHALQSFELERRVTLPARFRLLEASRLERLLTVWLDLESRRVADFEVIACERPAEVEIEGIKVKMVVDRIDQLADGRQVIIDYKTGVAIDVRNWAEARITEPQLPIYAALVADEVTAVVFAKVIIDKPAFAGVADDKDILPGVQGIGDEKQKIFNPAEFPDWIAVVTHWRERLHAIAREVKAGEAGVMFNDESALRYCEVLPLLRLAERRRLLAEAVTSEGA